MAKQVMIAVSVELRDALQAEARRIELAHESHQWEGAPYNDTPANSTRPHVSLAAVLQLMLDQRLRRRERRRKAGYTARWKRAMIKKGMVPQIGGNT